jgi:hypothetical protein
MSSGMRSQDDKTPPQIAAGESDIRILECLVQAYQECGLSANEESKTGTGRLEWPRRKVEVRTALFDFRTRNMESRKDESRDVDTFFTQFSVTHHPV